MYDSLQLFKTSFCKTDEEKNAIDLILSHRDKKYISHRLDTTKATKIKITEGYNYSKKKYKIQEDYYVDTFSSYGYYHKELLYSYNERTWWKEKYFDTVVNSVKYFNPYPKLYIIACGQVKHPRNESKIIAKLRTQTENRPPTKETFYVLTTVIDKTKNKISFELFIPQIGRRQFCTDVYCISETNSLQW